MFAPSHSWYLDLLPAVENTPSYMEHQRYDCTLANTVLGDFEIPDVALSSARTVQDSKRIVEFDEEDIAARRRLLGQG